MSWASATSTAVLNGTGAHTAHIYQYNVPVCPFGVAATPAEAESVIGRLGGEAVLKSQVSRAGRADGLFSSGLRGGIQLVRNPEQGRDIASKMIGHKLKTEDTFDEGVIVDKLHISRSVEPTEQWYLSLSVDREHYTPCITVSKCSGASLSSIARDRPETLFQFHFKNSDGISADLMSQIAAQVRLSTVEATNMEAILKGMHQIFVQKDATHLEINPLARLLDETLACVSANFTFDDAAAKRQTELFALRDKAQAVPEEIEAEKYGLVYVKMDGNIGNVVNGAGLAMATNDAIGLYGGKSANFLDAGGQATKETMVRAFDIVLRDKRVNTILVNVYGGITNCAMIAESIIGAAAELGPLRVPLVVRLQGTNSAQGLKMLEKANLGLHVEADFGAAAEKAVLLSGGYPCS